jgi:hypothetical protein
MDGGSPDEAILSRTWCRLLVLSCLALILFLCGDATFGSDDPARLSPYEKQLFHSINQYWIRNGLNPSKADKTLQFIE